MAKKLANDGDPEALAQGSTRLAEMAGEQERALRKMLADMSKQ